MKRLLQILITNACLAAAVIGVAHAQTQTVTAHDAWMREPAPSRDVTAVFVVLDNSGPAARAVVSAACEAADKAELHEMKNENGMMRMSPVKSIPLPAGKTELKPGGLHIMIFGLKQRPAVGDHVSVTLTLDDGSTVPVSAVVRKQESQQ
jgi:hypothetical protein